MNQEKIGKFIYELRKEKGMTQSELAEKMGVTDKSVSRWENGKTLPDISLLLQLSNVLDITLPELLKGRKLSKEELNKQKENIENIIEYDTNRKYEETKKTNIRYIIGFIILSIAILSNYNPFLEVIFKKEAADFVQGFLYGIGIIFELSSIYNSAHQISLQERKKQFIKNIKRKK